MSLDVDVDDDLSIESQPVLEPMQDEKNNNISNRDDTKETEAAEEEKRTCGICFEEVKEQGVLDSCRHDFCFDCIHRWSKVANSCPMCKAAFYTISRRQDDTNATAQQGADEEAQDEDAYAGDRPGKRRRGRRAAAAATANKRSRTTKKKKKPDVVRVKPKKQQYRYSRREIEDIARAAEAAEINRPRVLHGYHDHASLFSRVLMPQQAGVLPFFFGLGPAAAADQSESEGERHRSDGEDDDENEDEDHVFGPEDDESLFAATAPLAGTAERRRAYQPPRQRQPEHWGETAVDERHAGARSRIRNVLESRVRMRVDGGRLGPFARYGGRAPWMAPNPGMRSALAGTTAGSGGGGEAHADFASASAAHRQQHQQAMAQGLESLKSMFGETMDAEVLEAVLQQVGGSVERAVDALFAMQGSSDSPVASSEDSTTSSAVVDLTTSTSPSSSSATTAPSSPSPYEASWSPPRRCVRSSPTTAPSRAPTPASGGLRTSTSPPPSSSSSSASFADASLSAPIIFVSEEDVEIIAERKAMEPRRRHLGASRPRAASSQPSSAETSTTSSNNNTSSTFSPDGRLEMAVSSSTSSPSRAALTRRLPVFGRRFCPPRPLDTTSPLPVTLPPPPLPPLVPDDADRRPDVSCEEGVERAWRDFAEVQRETRRERKRQQTQEELSQLASSSSSSSTSTALSSSATQPAGRLRLPGTTTSSPGPTRR